MSSPNISFDTIGTNRKPGQYFEFNTRLAVRTLPGNTQKVLMIAPMLASGSSAPLVIQSVFSDEEAATYFGRGSLAHLMATAAIGAYPYLQLQIVGVSDAATATAATGKVTVTGTASSSGKLSVSINGTRIDVGISAADTAETIAAALTELITQKDGLPVTATANAGEVTLTCRHKGAVGNDIIVSSGVTAAGITAAATTLAGGNVDPDITPALAAAFSAGHNIVVCPFSTQEAMTALRNHLTNVSNAMEQRGAIGVGGWRKSLSTGIALAASLNDGRITLGWHSGSVKTPAQIAAAYAAVIASEEDPARPLNTLAMSTLDVTAVESQPGRTEQENALRNGLTPFEIGPGDKVQIVRAISTYTKNAQGVDDVALLDITTIRTLDYVRKACRERIALRFPRDKLSSRTPPKVRSELLDVLYKLEELEIVEEVDANKDGLIVERDLQDANQLNGRIPADVVNGLHVFAGRIDLLL
ncbi:bacteriophage Mu tail sheath family protein [Enterobacter hormaechei]|uniref:Bacteriophage Mu tail sheath family protein n=2 Tax=Enterobacter cloacae complex TaxID=354276 RepID=A0A376F5B6_ENTAS|nr:MULTISPECIES: phage tail sheath subtilisin-like domain-containing protein [Enterobacter cloacae complex]AMA02458.1 tail sheath protein [Enterobacter asburiae]MCM7510872.1 phage tail sheath subtilisin-like domain-containing protein [Enterobacter hormaechei]QPS67506.1 phage tail sheath subtilisin-like domain-containing protein [Enterobacter asburiae]TYF57036.1 phage tail protein [Enterobacter hormaechei]CZX84490.1 bacteriophage Mu tail sheath family protein [Enterobacter hormaechei]